MFSSGSRWCRPDGRTRRAIARNCGSNAVKRRADALKRRANAFKKRANALKKRANALGSRALGQ